MSDKELAVIFTHGVEASMSDAVLALCRAEGFDVCVCADDLDGDGWRGALPASRAALFLPAVETDCQGVKRYQIARLADAPHVIVLYAPTLPSAEYLCLAFREGVDDVISLDAGDEALSNQIARASRRLRIKRATSGAEALRKQEVASVQRHCERLERDNARWRERLLALSATSGRVATGALDIAVTAPSLLIVASAQTQAAGAKDVAARLGFEVRIVSDAAEAIDAAASRPPDVVLTDGTLPDMDALALTKKLRHSHNEHPMTIVAWSSNPESEDTLLAPSGGIDDFVPKSSTSEGVGLLVAALLGALR